MALHSVQVERHVLGGLIQNPQVIADIEQFVQDKDFKAEPHKVIYGCLRASFLKNEKLDKVLLAQQINNLGISFKDQINIFDYITSISFAPITAEATKQACQELVKFRVLREIDTTADQIKSHIAKSVNQDLSSTISQVDAIYGDKMTSFEVLQEPDDIFSDIIELVEDRGNNPVDEIGLTTPYPEFNRLYGGLRGGGVYAIASRPGQGKTTWLSDMGCEAGHLNGVPVLILDTEMVSEEIKFRRAAAYSGVPLWYLETGKWRNDPKMVDKVRTRLKDLKHNYKVYHYHVGNRHIDEVLAIIRRWYLSVVGRGKPCIVIYDYLKLTGERVAQNWAEYQAMGEKIDKAKRLAVEFNFPFLTAIQLNRTGENAGRDSKMVVDDGAAIAISDRLAWFATYLGIFRRKTADEIILDTEESGTHKLIELKARYQGRDAAGHQDMILREFPDGTKKYVRNYINFTVKDFAVVEKGSLRDAIARQNAQFLVTDPPKKGADIQEETL